MGRPILALALSLWASGALADDTLSKPLPSLALDPQPQASIWHGFHVGSDVYGVVGGKGSKGFVGGSVTAGYDRVLPSSAVLSIDASTGIAPGFSAFGPLRAYDFASAGARIGYPMGRWTPYLTTDLVLAKPNARLGGSFNGVDTANDLFNSPEKLDAGGRVGAGVDYALTKDVTVGVAVSVQRGAAAVFP